MRRRRVAAAAVAALVLTACAGPSPRPPPTVDGVAQRYVDLALALGRDSAGELAVNAVPAARQVTAAKTPLSLLDISRQAQQTLIDLHQTPQGDATPRTRVLANQLASLTGRAAELRGWRPGFDNELRAVYDVDPTVSPAVVPAEPDADGPRFPASRRAQAARDVADAVDPAGTTDCARRLDAADEAPAGVYAYLSWALSRCIPASSWPEQTLAAARGWAEYDVLPAVSPLAVLNAGRRAAADEWGLAPDARLALLRRLVALTRTDGADVRAGWRRWQRQRDRRDAAVLQAARGYRDGTLDADGIDGVLRRSGFDDEAIVRWRARLGHDPVAAVKVPLGRLVMMQWLRRLPAARRAAALAALAAAPQTPYALQHPRP